ncbi:hypothetical protein M422DRAFT_777181 [Sphaerobolus stellatus SS14]|nr:hypothetical protein M422DRAFT_777181 [Sphaerobolus stellatus SS14]
MLDGWFREISSQWPGQAMTLKVHRVLHVEKSKYHDVLVLESETYGNMLVLDGSIRCTEWDEFSYHEMLAHSPLSTHPNPKKVLVIGGGNGGVVREVLKHNSVEEVVLCEIDEAVIRVSKQYLPHISSLLESPRVTVCIRDGFKFLAKDKSTYDVIIIDSSDLIGSAQSLSDQAYFQLLYNALAPGGHLSTKAKSLWIHLDFINGVLKNTKRFFPTVEYSYTTIPTYPSGQIGFIFAAKAEGRDLTAPLRDVKPTRYWNKDVHKASFVLPDFGIVMLRDGKNILPVLGAQRKEGAKTRKVLLLGSGFVARPAAEYIVRDPMNDLVIACRTFSSAQALAEALPRTTAISLDVNSTSALEKAVADADLVVSLIPYTHHTTVVKAAIKGRTHVVTTSYISPAMRELNEEAKKAGIVVMNEIGVDPGIDHLYAVKLIDEVHAKGGKIKQFFSYCGGLPAPEASDNPLGYKFSWSSRGVLLNLLSGASYLMDGRAITISDNDLMKSAKPYFITPAYAFVGYPNRDSKPFKEFYNIPEAKTVLRGNLRYQGFPEFVVALVKVGFLDVEPKEWLKEGLTWAEITQNSIGANDASEASLISRIDALVSFPSESERTRIISGLRWIGLFSETKASIRSSNIFDTLCARLEEIMKYEPGERDLVMLQHKFVIQWKDGSEQTITSTLEEYGDPTGHSAMALTVGVPCGDL